eukprot:m.192255 g.192255  ORF g.192255 m.192255 type:complete len:377 (+) comp14851_c2_seq3:1192-2322(+)
MLTRVRTAEVRTVREASLVRVMAMHAASGIPTFMLLTLLVIVMAFIALPIRTHPQTHHTPLNLLNKMRTKAPTKITMVKCQLLNVRQESTHPSRQACSKLLLSLPLAVSSCSRLRFYRPKPDSCLLKMLRQLSPTLQRLCSTFLHAKQALLYQSWSVMYLVGPYLMPLRHPCLSYCRALHSFVPSKLQLFFFLFCVRCAPLLAVRIMLSLLPSLCVCVHLYCIAWKLLRARPLPQHHITPLQVMWAHGTKPALVSARLHPTTRPCLFQPFRSQIIRLARVFKHNPYSCFTKRVGSLAVSRQRTLCCLHASFRLHESFVFFMIFPFVSALLFVPQQHVSSAEHKQTVNPIKPFQRAARLRNHQSRAYELNQPEIKLS